MKWGNFKVQDWDDLWKAVMSIAIIIIVVFMLVDYINWRTALDIIKKDLPTQWNPTASIYIKEYGYIPFVWRGDFRHISINAGGTRNSVGDVTNLVLQIGDHDSFWMPISKGYGSWHFTPSDDPDMQENKWYQQEFNDIETYVKITPVRYYLTDHYCCDCKVLVFCQTEERNWLIEKTITLRWSCGLYWYGGWAK